MGKQYGFYIDSAKCTGCKTCQLACKDYKDLQVDVSFRRVYEYTGGSWQADGNAWNNSVFAYYLSIACNHCADPACTKVCPSGAMHKRAEDGLVAVNEDVCIGCKSCAMACPYGAPQYDPRKGHMTKCNGCNERVAEGKKTGVRRSVSVARPGIRADRRVAGQIRRVGGGRAAARGQVHDSEHCHQTQPESAPGGRHDGFSRQSEGGKPWDGMNGR